MCELIEDLMMLADKCSEDNPADELGLLLVRAVGQMRGDAAALAAKDARIAELEQKNENLDPQAALAPAAVVSVQICKLGVYGKAFDLPSEARAYSYEHQPDNGGAYKLGAAAGAVRVMSAGDSIDAGLNLLKALAGEGFGVFELRALLGKEGE